MPLFIPSNISSLLKNTYVFLDNDFLNLLFKNVDVFDEFFKFNPSDLVEYDPFTEFEFLRDMFLPAERIKREEFLSLPVFVPVSNHQAIFEKTSDNALILSKIYALNKTKADTGDLFLAGRVMMFNPTVHLIITGNKKHFPNCVWDLVSAFTYFDSNETFKTFSILRFNRDKFDKHFDTISNLPIPISPTSFSQQID